MPDTKLSDLTDITPNLTVDDLMYVVNNPGGTPASRKATISEFITLGASTGNWFNAVVAVSDQDVSSNTVVADDNELRFDLVAGAIYEFETAIIYSSPAGGATPDFKWGYTGPATLVGQRTVYVYISTADATTSAPSQATVQTATFAAGTATTQRVFIERGWVTSSGGGSGASGFKLQWAQNTSSASATRRHAGSAIRYRRLV